VKIDTHAHVFVDGCALAAGRRYDPEGEAPISEYLRHLDENGMDHGVLVQPSFLGTDNSYLVSALGQAPTRLRGIAVVDPQISDGDMDVLAAAGVVGIRLNLVGAPPSLDLKSPPWNRLLHRIAERDWLLQIQSDGPELPDILASVNTCDARLIIDNFGRVTDANPRSSGGLGTLLDVAESGRLWLKLSGPYRFPADARALAKILLESPGPDRLIWGSDWPWTQNADGMTYARTLAWLDEWIPDASARKKILADTPASLFGFV
jgi:predicted TIM-barrel fold metal-dependent hydrolase